ncbi:MAG: NAD(P)/FAD-dependent oxidoreductase [Ferruginibacter sp.]
MSWHSSFLLIQVITIWHGELPIHASLQGNKNHEIWRNIRIPFYMIKPSIIIIGAGATGLIAAKELSRLFKVTILEAQSHTGGRLHSISMQGNLIEAGAEFVHGNPPFTLALLKKAGIDCVKTEGEMYRKRNGRFTRAVEITEGWDGLLEKMKAVKEDISIQELLETYYGGPGNELLRRHVKSYAEGFDLADITRASVKALYREWSTEDYNSYRIPAGYSKLALYLQKQAETQGSSVFTCTPVKEVEWQQGAVKVYAADGEKYTADKLLVTVPVSVLQQPASNAYIQFTPPIHFDENTAGKIGFGAVIKVVLKFKNRFWQEDAGFVLSEELFSTWWTQLPDLTPILTGWLGGPGAAAISNETDEAIVEKSLASLAAIYDKPVLALKEALVQAMVFNWQKNQYVMGAYSYATMLSETAINIMTTPLAGTVFFAGEALYTGVHPGTAEAALASGITAAASIINSGKYP